MNDNEAKQFIRDLINAFPSFETAAKDSYDLAATHRNWAKAWDDLALDECQRVLSHLIKTGNIDWSDYRAPGPFIRRLVMQARGNSSEQDRSLEQNRMERMQRQRDYTGSPMAAALAKAMEMRKAGKSEAEINEAIDVALGPAPPAYDQPRYNCHACMDRGLVDVWRADVVKLLREGRMNYEQLHTRHTYPIACTCSKGELRNQVKKPLPVFSDKWCLFRDGDWEDEVNKLREFINRRPSNYEPAFEYVG